MDIEQEIQARVNFKLNELLTSVENQVKLNWQLAFNNNSAKHSYYWEAFSQFKGMLTKEMNLPVPYNNMTEIKKRERRDKAIKKIMERFCKRGTNDYYEKEYFLVSVIEEAQNWDINLK